MLYAEEGGQMDRKSFDIHHLTTNSPIEQTKGELWKHKQKKYKGERDLNRV